MDEHRLPGEVPADAREDGGHPSVAEERDLETPWTAAAVVAVGASAGGLEVFKRLLAELPNDTGFAFVFVQHLDPTHHSMLAEILSRATPMPVHEAGDALPLLANHVYVIPANVDMTVAGGALHLAPRAATPGAHMSIDTFLRSVADNCGSRAIAVILSGTGTDGSAGVEAIKAAGGVTFAQDSTTAKFPTMPDAAVATGCVDFILPPELIAAELARLGTHPYIANPAGAPPEIGDDDDRFGAILSTLHIATGIDFSTYRERLVKRRILRRLALRNIDGLDEYRRCLENDSDELMALQRDLLISVTSFFRDPDAFQRLSQLVLPRIFQGRPAHETVRIWVAGCASGEEAYSVAILLREYMAEAGTVFPIQIFASDISQSAIEKARLGRYSEKIAVDLSPKRLARFFTPVEGGYQVNKDLREMCVFTRHNLIDDPPFSRLDLITCRNVLIYLAGVQAHIIPRLHYALKPSGFLMLGSSEAAASADLFSVVDRPHRLYSRRETARKHNLFPAGPRPSLLASRASGASPPSSPGLWAAVDAHREVDRILLARYSPAGVVVDDNLEVLEIRGQPSPYLSLPAGKVSFNLMKLIPDTGLFLEVEKLIQQARLAGEPARAERVPFELNARPGALNIEAVPLLANHKRSVLVLFEPAPQPAPNQDLPPDTSPRAEFQDRQITHLKRQLAEAKERFLTAIETHQNWREESQNTTEEALSANEELQSLNEELETIKEELQSTNEELVTVNDELSAKNTALVRARDFAMAVVEAVRQPLLVLDTDLRVKLANRAFCRTFHVSATEIEGADIFLFSGGLWDLPGLRDHLDALSRGANALPDFEVDQAPPGGPLRNLLIGGCRIQPLQLLLLAVDDITDRKIAQLALRKSQEHLRQAQKMEAVGRLAGGIAHDFNNLLTIIIGYSNLLADSLAGHADVVPSVDAIRNAGERAASLTRQLLAFSRRQVLQPKVLDLNLIVAEFERMLHRLTGDNVSLLTRCAPGLWQVRADAGELGRALMNLALNARDAMPDGGTLTVSTANCVLSAGQAEKFNLSAGRYVTLAVTDTGNGITPELQAQIFEPFFTTKEAGKGTGLGLATVLGVVQQSGGAVHCQSELGLGSTFTVYLPAISSPAESLERPARSLARAPKGTEVILLVEDEEIVRTLARSILEASGYVVLDASDGRAGLVRCETHDGPIHLLLSDVVMPELGGRALAEGALKLRPDLKVLFMSGHTQDAVLHEGIAHGVPFLAKPFTPSELAHKVRETLEGPPPPAGLI